jgi:methionine sulfoxide reductase heme-binding subunit
VILLAAASSQPSAYWFATRGLGVASLVLLTGTVVLGIGTVGRWREEATPGFVVANLHRNLSLLAVITVILHVTTTILDPFAHITVRDALVPVDAAYRPVWLGLGVVAFEVLLAVSATSLLRDRIGVHAWRAIHWAAYLSWPVALVHGLGTGSDAQAPWMIGHRRLHRRGRGGIGPAPAFGHEPRRQHGGRLRGRRASLRRGHVVPVRPAPV